MLCIDDWIQMEFRLVAYQTGVLVLIQQKHFFVSDNQFVNFGGIVSTSNTYSSNVVTLQSDGMLYWSMGITENES